MIRYVLKRLLLMIPVVLGVIILVFTVLHFGPGDVVSSILDPTATEAQMEELREALGLNRPYIVQLGDYIADIFLRFDFGESYITHRSVGEELMTRFPRTLTLAIISIILAVIIGIPLGIIAALNRGKVPDTISMLISLLGVSMPGFWAGLMLALVFGVYLEWFPPFGMGGLEYYILPCVTNSLVGLATLARQTRSSMLEVISSDYITTARAKGLSKRAIVWKHMLPNSLIPLVTVIGSTFGKQFGGMVVTEIVFSIQGIGTYMVDGVNQRDYPAVLGSIIFIAVTFSVIMLLVDLAYAFIDPRIKARYSSKGRRRVKNV